jgi:hypothetical protein
MKYPDEIATVIGLLGNQVSIEDASLPVDWIGANFPFSPGSTVEWTRVPAAKTIRVSFSDEVALKLAFEQLVDWVGASDDQPVFVVWRNGQLPALSMSLSDCRNVFPRLADVVGGEMHFASPEGGWYMEFDKFFDECHGARVQN